MKRIVIVVLSLSLLAGCASQSPEAQLPPQPGRPDAADTFLAVIGTPFLWAVKIPVCVASAVVAAPIAGAASVSANGQEATRSLRDGVRQNCGPPWAFEP